MCLVYITICSNVLMLDAYQVHILHTHMALQCQRFPASCNHLQSSPPESQRLAETQLLAAVKNKRSHVFVY